LKPELHSASHPKDPLFQKIATCISSIDCEEYFASHLEKSQAEQARIVKRFQQAVIQKLTSDLTEKFDWKEEHLPTLERRDAVDIFGTSGNVLIVIELDKNRADQVAKKFLSRSALFKEKSMYYISLCYPGTRSMNVSECRKYFGYCADLSEKLNNVYAGFIIPAPLGEPKLPPHPELSKDARVPYTAPSTLIRSPGDAVR
jgi:hypothetical protein